MQPAPPTQSPTTKKKSDRGCLIALAIVGGVLLLVLSVGGYGIYSFSQSSKGKAIFGAIGDTAQIVAEAQNAPGTKELRGLGCTQAMVMDMDKMAKMLGERFDAGNGRPAELSKMVTCQVGAMKTPPTCDAVAQTYVAAAGAPERGFVVSVTKGSIKADSVCTDSYTPDGRKLKDIDPGSTPTMPGRPE